MKYIAMYAKEESQCWPGESRYGFKCLSAEDDEEAKAAFARFLKRSGFGTGSWDCGAPKSARLLEVCRDVNVLGVMKAMKKC